MLTNAMPVAEQDGNNQTSPPGESPRSGLYVPPQSDKDPSLHNSSAGLQSKRSLADKDTQLGSSKKQRPNDYSSSTEKPTPGGLYLSYWKGKWFAAMVLPLTSFDDYCLPLKFDQLPLLKETPRCYDCNLELKIDYQDGGKYAHRRKVPLMWFDDKKSLKNCNFSWVLKDALEPFDPTQVQEYHNLLIKYRSEVVKAHQAPVEVGWEVVDKWLNDQQSCEEANSGVGGSVTAFRGSQTSRGAYTRPTEDD